MEGGDPYGNVETLYSQPVELSKERISPFENIGAFYLLSSEKPPPDGHEKAATPACLATDGVAAEPFGGEASGLNNNSTLHPFRAIGPIIHAIVARLALGGAA